MNYYILRHNNTNMLCVIFTYYLSLQIIGNWLSAVWVCGRTFYGSLMVFGCQRFSQI